MISKEKIEEVRLRANIVQVISDYVPLKKRGTNYIGLCPFHSEKTPSFSVSEEKNMFYCFGCNAAGGAITFVMKKDGLGFPDAVRALAARFGVVITEEKKAARDFKDTLYSVNRAASEFFVNELKGAAGSEARDYLVKRGYASSPELLNAFGVGYAPDRWDGLIIYLKRKGIDAGQAEKAGLVVKKKEGGFYDRFRNRLIFPIADLKGRVIAFGGRSLGDREPKYLNSPETALFKKGETLYGLPFAKERISKEGFAIAVEGYFDLLAMHRHGFTNCVATMGTALTKEHIRLLKGFASSVYALFDADDAGKRAAMRSLDLFLDSEMPARAVILPGAKDPDEFLASHGAPVMKKAVDEAEPLMEFCLRELQKRFQMNAPEGKKKYLEAVLPYLKRVRNVAEKGHYAAFVAPILGIPVESVYKALGHDGIAPVSGALHRAPVSVSGGTNLQELTVLKVIVRHPEFCTPQVEAAIDAFTEPLLKEAGKAVCDFYRENKALDHARLVEEIEDEHLKGLVALSLIKDSDGFIEEPEKMLKDCLKKILNRGKLKVSTQEMIKMLEESGMADIAGKMRERAHQKGSPGKS